MQFQRPWDLAYLSQPKTSAEGVGASMADINGRYAYDQTSAEGVTIYMVDTVRLSLPTAQSLADGPLRVLTPTMWYGSYSWHDGNHFYSRFCRSSLRLNRSGNGPGPTIQGLQMGNTKTVYKETMSTQTANPATEL